MKKIIEDKSLFDGTTGLSCIENYFLYTLKAENFPYEYLYYKSYIPLWKIVKSFVAGAKYESFYTIQRLHSVAAENNFITIFNYNESNLINFEKHDYNCIMLNLEFIKAKYKRTPWRNDHYILVANKISDNKYTFINDNPRDIGEITEEELKVNGKNKMISFDFSKKTIQINTNDYLKFFYNSLLTSQMSTELPYIDNLVFLRDIVGVFKVMARRVYYFLSKYIDMNFYEKYLKNIETQFMALEYMRMVKEYNIHRISTLLPYLQKEEEKINLIIMEKLRGKYDL